MGKIRVSMVHQGIWDMEKVSMPLALGYLKATALTDAEIRANVDMRIFSFNGGHRVVHMVPPALIGVEPDILACSVFGWNFRSFCHMAETYRQMNRSGWVVFGGTHVSHQAERVFRLCPEVDVVANGEGELTFLQLLQAYLAGKSKHELDGIQGISFRREDGEIVTNEDRPRIKDLDEIPSPFLTGVIPMTDEAGEFLYDAATMETNRGCPYKCAFCYWGGAIGQKVYTFSRERLKEELEFFARHRVAHVALCDANFGMLQADADFLDDFLEVRARTGFPCNLISSWAKNKGKVFYGMVRKMKETGLQSDFTLALQTLSPAALETAKRSNMKVNDFQDLCQWLRKENLNAYAELIWGLPGETYDSFIEGYDRLARYVPKIATYSNLMIPNTSYDREREKYKFVTFRSPDYDYEYILSHSTMSFEDNQRMHIFLFWARVLSEYQYFKYIFTPLRELVGLTNSQVILDYAHWIRNLKHPSATALRAAEDEVVRNLDTTRIYGGLRVLYGDPEMDALSMQWWTESILPKVPEDRRAFFHDLFEYELLAHAVHDDKARRLKFQQVQIEELDYYVRPRVFLQHDVRSIVEQMERGENPSFESRPHGLVLYYKAGFATNIDNHEVLFHYAAHTMEDIERESMLRRRGHSLGGEQRHVVGLPLRSAKEALPVVD